MACCSLREGTSIALFCIRRRVLHACRACRTPAPPVPPTLGRLLAFMPGMVALGSLTANSWRFFYRYGACDCGCVKCIFLCFLKKTFTYSAELKRA